MTGYKIKREIFASLPAIDSRLEDLEQPARDQYIKNLYNNTKRVISQGILVPVKEGHYAKESERLHGSLQGVELKYKSAPSPHWVIIGKIFLDNEYYTLFKDGHLPAISVEIADSANLSAYTGNEEDKIGQYIYGVALCGTNPVAMPQLQVLNDVEPQQAHAIYVRLVGDIKYNFRQYKEQGFMDEKIMNLKEMLMAKIGQIIDEALMPQMEGQPSMDEEMIPKEQVMEEMKQKFQNEEEMAKAAAEDAAKKEDEEPQLMQAEEPSEKFQAEATEKDSQIAKLQADLTAQKKAIDDLQKAVIEKDYQLLATAGKVAPEQKDNFVRIAKNEGLEFARQVYSAQAPMFDRKEYIQSVETVDTDLRHVDNLSNLGMDTDQIKKHMIQTWVMAGVPADKHDDMWAKTYSRMANRKKLKVV